MKNLNSFNSEQTICIENQNYKYFDLKKIASKFNLNLDKIPISLKIILENLIRNEDGESIDSNMINSVFKSMKANTAKKNNSEIAFFPTRVLMQDFTGVPAVADLAAMRNALKNRGIEPKKINPLSRVDLVIDHSVMVDNYKDKLDSALKRSGRVDYELEFVHATRKQSKNMYNYFFNENCDEFIISS